MAKLNLLQKLDKLSEIILVIMGITVTKTREGDRVAILALDEPIEYVRGSQEIDMDGKKIPLEAYDVTEVKVHENDIVEAGEDFEFDEEGQNGVYRGTKLILDVAKSGQVWLRSQSFAAAGGEMRRANQQDRVSKIVEGALNRRKQAEGGRRAGTQLVDTNGG